MLKPQFDNIPAELTLVDRWVCWGGGKRPFSPSTGRPASIKKASDWSKFHTAKATYTRGGFDGVGLVLTGDGLVGIDIDKCVTSNGEPEPSAIKLLHDMGVGYTELSPSGTGLRGFGYSEPLRSGRRGEYRGLNLELYSEGRYLTVTGHRLPGFAGEIVELNGFSDFAKQIGSEEVIASVSSVSLNLCNSESLYLCISVGNPESFHPDCRPVSEGQRHRKLFQLARWVKAHEPQATEKRLSEIARAWFLTFAEFIGTKDIEVTVAEFITAFIGVKFAHGDGSLDSVIKNPPELPKGLDIGELGPKGQTLLRICWGLQLLDPNNPFFLASRTAGEAIGIHYTDAATYLRLFVAKGWIERTELGKGLKASRYRFKWSA